MKKLTILPCHIGLVSLLVALLFASLTGRAQSSQVVRGVVTDKTSEKPLAGVSVTIPGTSLGAITDESGRYVLPAVPLGRHAIAFGSAGYHQITIPEVLVTAGHEVVLDAALEQRLVTLNTLTITARSTKKGAATNVFAAGSARSFNPEDVTRYA